MSNMCDTHYKSMEVGPKCWVCRIAELEAENERLKARSIEDMQFELEALKMFRRRQLRESGRCSVYSVWWL